MAGGKRHRRMERRESAPLDMTDLIFFQAIPSSHKIGDLIADFQQLSSVGRRGAPGAKGAARFLPARQIATECRGRNFFASDPQFLPPLN